MSDKTKLKKIDIYSFILILIIFAADRLSKMYVIKLIQSQEKEFFIFDFLNIRQQVNIAIEEKRSNKEIGSSLEADIEIKLPKFEYDILNDIDANELFITSNTVKNILENKKNKTTVLVRKAEGIKCSRCWKILKKKCERNHCPIKQN